MLGLSHLSPLDFWCLGTLCDGQSDYSESNNPANLSPFLKRRLESLQWLCPTISFSPRSFNYLADFLSHQSVWLYSSAMEGSHGVGEAMAVTLAQWGSKPTRVTLERSRAS